MCVSEDVRRQLITFCSSRRTRSVTFTRDAPCDWGPTGITRPGGSEPFTEDGAWEFIAEHLKMGCAIEAVELRKPPGKKAYVLKLAGHHEAPTIYIKLQLLGDRVLGRSFHYARH